MRFSFAVAVAVMLVVISTGTGVFAQQKPYNIKHSGTDKEPKSTVALPQASSARNTTASTSKELQNLETQTARSSAASSGKGKSATGRTTAKVSTIKPLADKPNPPINVGKTRGTKVGTVNQSANPYNGRLKQKNSHP
jgi:cytoskeletal protein RodZ